MSPAYRYRLIRRPCWAFWRPRGEWIIAADWPFAFPLTWNVRDIDGKRIRMLTVPAGFTCDLASIPRPLWVLAAPNELGLAAPTLHDWWYRYHDGRVSRPTADRVFRLLMQRDGVGWLRRWAAWSAVRLFGWFAWRR